MTITIKVELRCALITLVLILFVALTTLAQKPELVVQAGHRSMVRALAISTDNKLLASAGADKTIIIWNLVEEKQILSLAGHDAWVFALAFSPDAKFLASGSYDGIIKVWNLSSAKIEFEISSVQPYNINSLVFSPDGNTLAIASGDKAINLWDMRNGKMKLPLHGHSDSVTQVAFSRDGNTLISSSLDRTIRIWNLATGKSEPTGKLSQGIARFAYSPNGVLAINLTGGSIIVLNTQIHKATAIQFQGFTKLEGGLDYRRWRRLFSKEEGDVRYSIVSLAFISDSELAFVDGFKVRIWDITADREKFSKDIESSDGSYALTINRQGYVLIYNDGIDIKLLDLQTLKERRLKGGFTIFKSVAFSSDGKGFAGNFGSGFQYWPQHLNKANTEAMLSSFVKLFSGNAVYLSFQGVAAIFGGKVESTDIAFMDNQLKPRFVLKGHSQPVNTVAVNPEETILASGSKDGTVKLWDLRTHQVLQTIKESAKFVQFSPDGKSLAMLGNDIGIRILEVGSWREKQVIDRAISSTLLFTPDSKSLITYTPVGKLEVWDLATGKSKYSYKIDVTSFEFTKGNQFVAVKSNFEPHGYVLYGQIADSDSPMVPVAVSPKGNLFVRNEVNRENGNYLLKIHSLDTGNELHTLTGHTDSIRSVAFSPNGEILASASWDRTVKLWSVGTGKELATFILFDEDIWVIYTPDGHFDTNLDLDELNRLSWSWPADPFNPLSVRVFMRDYFDPKLLQKLLAGETLNPVRNLSTVNRTQPMVSIKEIKPDGPGTVKVTVEAASTVSKSQTEANGLPVQSGVFDVRLFRDRQLVANSTTDEALSNYMTKAAMLGNTQAFDEREMELWRRAHEVKLDTDGRARLTFHNIKLPQRDEIKEVSFSAYAFNNDRVTSETTPPYVYKLSQSAVKVKPRAYVVTVGVDANQSGWNLDFTAKSAEDMQQVLRDKLSGNYEVINVSLLSTLEPYSPRVTLKQATKENINTVLDILGGRPVSAERLQKIPNADALRTATPDDLVVLYIASHGYVDRYGNFYVVPYNTGRLSGVTESMLNDCLDGTSQQKHCGDAQIFIKSSISSDDFVAWWRGVDAGEIVMILDSCHSAAVPGREFKPGPLGDRNFGQLAYDKGMLILTATQPDRYASSARRQGITGTLLSSALISISKANQQQTLSEWLEEAESTVPELYEKLYPEVKEDEIQLPMFLDFTKKSKTAIQRNHAQP